MEDESWLELASGFGKNYQGAVGSLEKLASFASHTGKRWIAGKMSYDEVCTEQIVQPQ